MEWWSLGRLFAHAFNDLYYLERAAQVQVLALSTGRELLCIPEDICVRTFEQMQTDRDDQSKRFLEEIKRILDKEEPDYRDWVTAAGFRDDVSFQNIIIPLWNCKYDLRLAIS